MGTFSVWHWLIVLLIVVLVFGTKKLKNLGGDLGGAVKGFKDGMKTALLVLMPTPLRPLSKWLARPPPMQTKPPSTLKPNPSPDRCLI